MKQTYSRRNFIQSGALVTAACAASTAIPSLAQTAPASGKPSPVRLGLASYTFRKFNLEQALKRIKDLGLRHAEFYRGHIPLESSPEQIKAVLNLCKDYDVIPVAFGVEPFTKDHDANKKRFDESFYDPMRMSPDQFAARVKADVAKWESIVQRTGIQVE